MSDSQFAKDQADFEAKRAAGEATQRERKMFVDGNENAVLAANDQVAIYTQRDVSAYTPVFKVIHAPTLNGRGDAAKFAESLNVLTAICHTRARNAGWYKNKDGSEKGINAGERMMLMVSEIGEAMEAHRKSKLDDHLPYREGVEVEFADAVIRIFDEAGRLGLDLGGAIVDKLQYNAKREDHKPENRFKEGGKAY